VVDDSKGEASSTVHEVEHKPAKAQGPRRRTVSGEVRSQVRSS
jgi:hypothetical protein